MVVVLVVSGVSGVVVVVVIVMMTTLGVLIVQTRASLLIHQTSLVNTGIKILTTSVTTSTHVTITADDSCY